jgi:hypothetical protein
MCNVYIMQLKDIWECYLGRFIFAADISGVMDNNDL